MSDRYSTCAFSSLLIAHGGTKRKERGISITRFIIYLQPVGCFWWQTEKLTVPVRWAQVQLQQQSSCEEQFSCQLLPEICICAAHLLTSGPNAACETKFCLCCTHLCKYFLFRNSTFGRSWPAAVTTDVWRGHFIWRVMWLTLIQHRAVRFCSMIFLHRRGVRIH